MFPTLPNIVVKTAYYISNIMKVKAKGIDQEEQLN